MVNIPKVLIVFRLVTLDTRAETLVRKHQLLEQDGTDGNVEISEASSLVRDARRQNSMEVGADGSIIISDHSVDSTGKPSPSNARGAKPQASVEVEADGNIDVSDDIADSASKPSASLVRDVKPQPQPPPEASLQKVKAESERARYNSHITYIAGVPVHNMHKASDPDGWLLKLPSDFTDAQLQSLCQEASCTMVGHPSEGAAAIVSINATREALTALLQNHPEVEFADHDDAINLEPEPDDSSSSVLDNAVKKKGYSPPRRRRAPSIPWGLDRIDDRAGLDNSYDLTSADGAGVHVYVLDTGIRVTHDDFEGRASAAFDCTTWSSSCAGSGLGNPDRHGHGTHCAGTVAGKKYGVAKGARVYAGKVLSDSGSGYLSWIVNGIDWVVTNGQKPAIISMSLGGPGNSQSYKAEIDAAHNAGVVVVVAAGNDNDDACKYGPAFVPNAVTVGSTASSDGRSWFSNYGSCVDIFAPGSSILSASASSNSGSTSMSGTSMACPHVAGVAAVLKGREPSLTAQQLSQKLESTASTGKISSLPSGSPNKLLYVARTPSYTCGALQSNRDCTERSGRFTLSASSTSACQTKCTQQNRRGCCEWEHDWRTCYFQPSDQNTHHDYGSSWCRPCRSASMCTDSRSLLEESENSMSSGSDNVNKIQAKFKLLDGNTDGAVDKMEAIAGMISEQHFAELDANEDGFLNSTEYLEEAWY